MTNYEMVLVFRPQLNSEEVDILVKKIQEIVVSNKGEILDTNLWGKKKLAYNIKGCKEANFVYIEFTSPHHVPALIDKNWKLMDAIIRCMIFNKKNVRRKENVVSGQVSGVIDNTHEKDTQSKEELINIGEEKIKE